MRLGEYNLNYKKTDFVQFVYSYKKGFWGFL